MADMPISIASKRSASLIASKSLAQPHEVLQSLAACRCGPPNERRGLCPLTRSMLRRLFTLRFGARNPVVADLHVAALDRRLELREIKPPCAERH